eukprot:762639-Hanusia_phi.AAC.8
MAGQGKNVFLALLVLSCRHVVSFTPHALQLSALSSPTLLAMHSTRSSRTPPCTCQDKPMPQLSRRQLVGLSISTLLPVHAATAEMKWDKPREQDIETVQRAIRAFDSKRLTEAESLFSSAIESWKGMNRPRDELAELFKFRANARVDLKRFSEAKQDYDTVLAIMEEGEKQSVASIRLPLSSYQMQEKNGKATYMEYPDTFVQRGLCSEGLGKWEDAIAGLVSSDTSFVAHPPLQTTRAPSNCGEEAVSTPTSLPSVQTLLPSWEDTVRIEVELGGSDDSPRRCAPGLRGCRQNLRDEARALDVRANYALARYQCQCLSQMMTDIVRRNPGELSFPHARSEILESGYTDMHVALAAIAWSAGDRETAESEVMGNDDGVDLTSSQWEFACNKIQTGCSLYSRDMDWLSTVRRWPPSMVANMKQFLGKK